MIVLDLTCANGHRFEGWFASTEAFATQRGATQVLCPTCNSHEVRRVPAAVRISKGGVRDDEPVGKPRAMTNRSPLSALRAFIDQVRANSEDVGARFPEEARRIHYREAPERAIRGKATAAECRELHDEGIDLLPLPDLPPERLN